VGFLLRIWPNLRSGQGEIFFSLKFLFVQKKNLKKIFKKKNCMKEFEKTCFSLKDTKKPPEFRQICQAKIKLCRIGQIRQKSARNWEPARNIFCPLDNFQIRQNCRNLAEKTAIWPRWTGRFDLVWA
jgi:hypothetical protein